MEPPNRCVSRADEAYARATFISGVCFAAIAVCYFASARSFSLAKPPIDFAGFALGRDFLNAWMGGRSAFSGGPAPWFDPANYEAALRQVTGWPALHGYQWSYPPHLILFIWPLGTLPYLPAYALWCLVGLALYLAAAWSGGVTRRDMLFLAAAPAVAVNVLGGQNGFLTAALLVGGLANLDRRPILAGILFGILTIKPQFGLLIPLLLLLTGRWRVIIAASAATAVFVAATAIWFGPNVWTEFFRKVMPLQQQAIADAGRLAWPVCSAFVDARRIGLAPAPAWLVQAVVSAAAAMLVVWTYMRRRDGDLSLALFVTATFLFTPYMLNYDMVVFGFVIARLRARPDNTLADHLLALAVWSLPVAMVPLGLAHVPVAIPLLAVFAGRLVWRLARAPSSRGLVAGESLAAFDGVVAYD